MRTAGYHACPDRVRKQTRTALPANLRLQCAAVNRRRQVCSTCKEPRRIARAAEVRYTGSGSVLTTAHVEALEMRDRRRFS